MVNSFSIQVWESLALKWQILEDQGVCTGSLFSCHCLQGSCSLPNGRSIRWCTGPRELLLFLSMQIFLLLIPFLLRISDAGRMTLGRTALVVCNILAERQHRNRKWKKRKQKQRQKKGDIKRRWKIVGKRSIDKDEIFCKVYHNSIPSSHENYSCLYFPIFYNNLIFRILLIEANT